MQHFVFLLEITEMLPGILNQLVSNVCANYVYRASECAPAIKNFSTFQKAI